MWANPPFMNRVNGKRVQVVPPLPAPSLGDNQIRSLQYLQMLHHSTTVDITKMFAQRTGGERLVTQIVQYLPPDRRG